MDITVIFNIAKISNIIHKWSDSLNHNVAITFVTLVGVIKNVCVIGLSQFERKILKEFRVRPNIS